MSNLFIIAMYQSIFIFIIIHRPLVKNSVFSFLIPFSILILMKILKEHFNSVYIMTQLLFRSI